MSKRIALTGGIACGKSLVARYLRDAGYATLDADDIVHELIPDAEERRRIAAEVFANADKRRALEAKLHPLVRARLKAFDGIVIVPLLFEVHWDEEYDIICCVSSSREVQIERMMSTRGYTREEAEARLSAQMPVSEKAERSHYVIQNDSTPDSLRQKVVAFIDWLAEQQKQS